jgi:hypothetical protein
LHSAIFSRSSAQGRISSHLCLLFHEERNELGTRRFWSEVQLHLLLPFRMLLSPKLQKQRWRSREHPSCAMNFGVATRTELKHEPHDRLSRYAVMHRDGALIPTRSVADPAALAVSLQNCFPQPAEILFILPFQRVAGRAQSQRQNLGVAIRTMHDSLEIVCHFPALTRLAGFAAARPM